MEHEEFDGGTYATPHPGNPGENMEAQIAYEWRQLTDLSRIILLRSLNGAENRYRSLISREFETQNASHQNENLNTFSIDIRSNLVFQTQMYNVIREYILWRRRRSSERDSTHVVPDVQYSLETQRPSEYQVVPFGNSRISMNIWRNRDNLTTESRNSEMENSFPNQESLHTRNTSQEHSNAAFISSPHLILGEHISRENNLNQAISSDQRVPVLKVTNTNHANENGIHRTVPKNSYISAKENSRNLGIVEPQLNDQNGMINCVQRVASHCINNLNRNTYLDLNHSSPRNTTAEQINVITNRNKTKRLDQIVPVHESAQVKLEIKRRKCYKDGVVPNCSISDSNNVNRSRVSQIVPTRMAKIATSEQNKIQLYTKPQEENRTCTIVKNSTHDLSKTAVSSFHPFNEVYPTKANITLRNRINFQNRARSTSTLLLSPNISKLDPNGKFFERKHTFKLENTSDETCSNLKSSDAQSNWRQSSPCSTKSSFIALSSSSSSCTPERNENYLNAPFIHAKISRRNQSIIQQNQLLPPIPTQKNVLPTKYVDQNTSQNILCRNTHDFLGINRNEKCETNVTKLLIKNHQTLAIKNSKVTEIRKQALNLPKFPVKTDRTENRLQNVVEQSGAFESCTKNCIDNCVSPRCKFKLAAETPSYENKTHKKHLSRSLIFTGGRYKNSRTISSISGPNISYSNNKSYSGLDNYKALMSPDHAKVMLDSQTRLIVSNTKHFNEEIQKAPIEAGKTFCNNQLEISRTYTTTSLQNKVNFGSTLHDGKAFNKEPIAEFGCESKSYSNDCETRNQLVSTGKNALHSITDEKHSFCYNKSQASGSYVKANVLVSKVKIRCKSDNEFTVCNGNVSTNESAPDSSIAADNSLCDGPEILQDRTSSGQENNLPQKLQHIQEAEFKTDCSCTSEQYRQNFEINNQQMSKNKLNSNKEEEKSSCRNNLEILESHDPSPSQNTICSMSTSQDK